MRTWTFSQYLIKIVPSVILICLGNTGCTAKSSKSSVLIIAVEQLGSNAIDCSKETKGQNSPTSFEVLCRDFSRWTHAYTPSTLSVPAMTSMMTGEYPQTHGVHNNGANFLPSSYETVAEVAFRKGWSTLFISGGAPLLRKTGLSQGFEIFDDSVKPNLEIVHRPFLQSVQIFLNHLKESNRQSSLTWIYVPDLQFDKLQTKNTLGEPRNLSYESQLEQFDEELTKLFEHLKAQRQWENLTIILVGLNSHQRGVHHNLNSQNNLYGESTQVALYTKWAGVSPRATYDENVTLGDVGMTLYEIISGPSREATHSDFPTISLFTSSERQISFEDRWIAMETAWKAWKKQGDIQKAFRKGPYLCLRDETIKCYNSHIDREEMLPLAKIEARKLEFNESMKKYFSEASIANLQSPPFKLSVPSDHPCYLLIKSGHLQPSEMKKCEDSSVLDLAQWMYEDQNPQSDVFQKENAKKKFTRTLWNHLLDHKIEETNIFLGNIWDLSPERASRSALFDEVLAIPEVAKYKAQAQKSFSNYREDYDHP